MTRTAMIRSASALTKIDPNARTISYKFSDASVARDGHTISNAGWDLTNFKSNPVFLWAHDSSALPIGKVIEIGVTSSGLMGNVEYLSADEYPFADTVYRMVKAGYINATSVSWNPLEWKYSTDRNRPGGIDFLKQELLEVSQVPVPALPGALATARSRGFDTGPIYRWAGQVLDGGSVSANLRKRLEAIRRDTKMPTAKRTAFTKLETEADRRIEALAVRIRLAALDAQIASHDAEVQRLRLYHARTATVEGRIAEAKRIQARVAKGLF